MLNPALFPAQKGGASAPGTTPSCNGPAAKMGARSRDPGGSCDGCDHGLTRKVLGGFGFPAWKVGAGGSKWLEDNIYFFVEK